MDLPRQAKSDTASVGETEVIDHLEANRRTSNTNRIIDRNMQFNTQSSTYSNTQLHKKSRNIDQNFQDNTFGNLLMEKREEFFQIGFQNFNGLTGKPDDPVDISLRNWIVENSFDVFGISQVNMYWPRVRKDLQFHERVNGWWQPGSCRAIHAYNRTKKRKKRSI